jgi:putative oxidoreductase
MTTESVNGPKKGLHIALWIFQVLLGVAFLGAGLMKATQPLEELGKQMNWVTYTPGALVRFIGVTQVLGALGLILPSATRILPVLTPLAATGLFVTMVLAAGTHVMHDEAREIVPNIVLGALSAFIAWGRFKAAPISARR